jgi:hypothetical protein
MIEPVSREGWGKASPKTCGGAACLALFSRCDFLGIRRLGIRRLGIRGDPTKRVTRLNLLKQTLTNAKSV